MNKGYTGFSGLFFMNCYLQMVGIHVQNKNERSVEVNWLDQRGLKNLRIF